MAALPAIEPSFGTDMSMGIAVDRISYGDGYSQRANPGLNSVVQKWRLNYNAISEADATTLRDFVAGLAGVGVIEWTPFGQSVELKWTATGWTEKPSGYGIMDCSFVLTQEFDL